MVHFINLKGKNLVLCAKGVHAMAIFIDDKERNIQLVSHFR